MTEDRDYTIVLPPPFPDHTQLPESDGTFMKNLFEHPQSLILTDSIGPVLQQRHPDGQYAIGQDCGIYWRETDPPEKGAVDPDWFYVPNVPPNLDGEIRRDYVLWREFMAPLIALEFASGDGTEERDTTPLSRTESGEVSKLRIVLGNADESIFMMSDRSSCPELTSLVLMHLTARRLQPGNVGSKGWCICCENNIPILATYHCLCFDQRAAVIFNFCRRYDGRSRFSRSQRLGN